MHLVPEIPLTGHESDSGKWELWLKMRYLKCWDKLRRRSTLSGRCWPGIRRVHLSGFWERPAVSLSLPHFSPLASLEGEGKEQSISIQNIPGSRSREWILIPTLSHIRWLGGTPLLNFSFLIFEEMVWHLFLWQFYGLFNSNAILYFMNAMLKYYSFNSLVCRLFMDVWGLLSL